MHHETEKLFLKIIIVGDPGVGKTSILNQYCYKRFEETTKPTIGCDFSTLIISNDSSKVIKAQLWDVAGQEKFHALSKLYIRGAQGCVIVCDITDEESLASTLKWKELILNDESLSEEPIPIVLVQNKKDLIEQENSHEHKTLTNLQHFSQNNGYFACFQTSAKTSENLDDLFRVLIEEILNRLDKIRIRRASILENKRMSLGLKEKKKTCC